MAKIKNQYKRLCLIDTAIRTIHEPTKRMIVEFVAEHEIHVCESSIEKDLKFMRAEFDAPIRFKRGVKVNNIQWGYYYYKTEYSFWKQFIQYWGLFLDLPTEINNILYSESE